MNKRSALTNTLLRARIAVFAPVLACPLAGYASSEADAKLASIRFEQNLGEQLPLEQRFLDSQGVSRPLGKWFGERPVVLAFGYYDCPNLCSIVFDATSDALAALALAPAKDYEYIFISIDPEETPRMAAAAKRAYTRYYGKPGADEGWHFLTGEADAIASVAQAAGFRYRYDKATQQYAHPSGILVSTADGRVSKYLYGIEYDPRDLRLALVEAGSGEVGSPVDQLLLLCFHYNPLTGKYSFAINRALQAAGALTALALFTFVGRSLYRERLRRSRSRSG